MHNPPSLPPSLQDNSPLKVGSSKSWLLRLFESKLFDASMAMAYLFNSKEPGVLGYIGNKLFTYSEEEVDFYLPQMVNMYIMYHEVAEVLHPYIIHRFAHIMTVCTAMCGMYNRGRMLTSEIFFFSRCRQSADFSLRCAWLLDAYGCDSGSTSVSSGSSGSASSSSSGAASAVAVPSGPLGGKKRTHGAKLRNLILSGELVPKEVARWEAEVAVLRHKRKGRFSLFTFMYPTNNAPLINF